MNRSLFETFSFDKKKDVVFSYGELITKMKRASTEFRLYRVYSFLVEVQIDLYSRSTEIIQTIDEEKALQKFSEDIDLSELLDN